MSRTVKIVLIVLAAVLVLGAGAAGFLLYRQVQANQQAHLAVYESYQAFRENAEASSLTVHEDGREPVTVSFAELGLLEDLHRQIDAQFTETDRLDAAAFAELPYLDQLQYTGHPEEDHLHSAVASPADLSVGSLYIQLSQDRDPGRQRHEWLYSKGQFTYSPPTAGNEIDKDALYEAIRAQAAGYTVDGSAPGAYTLDLTDEFYIPANPAASDGEIADHFAQMLAAEIEKMEVSVVISDAASCALTPGTLSTILSVNGLGTVSIDEARLREIIGQWAATYDRINVPYVMNSFIDGPVEVSFLTCSYHMDQELMFQELCDLLLTLKSGSVNAVFDCLDEKGEPFPIGDTYVEVDLTTQVMTFFKDGQLITSTDIVSGRSWGYASPTGLFFAKNHEVDATLVGEDYVVFVKYWVSVTEDNMVGLHDASWRSYFGGNRYINGGSHGCINTPEEPMKLIFDNVEEGTPILVYHHDRPEGAQERPVYIVDDSPALWDAWTIRDSQMERTADSVLYPPLT